MEIPGRVNSIDEFREILVRSQLVTVEEMDRLSVVYHNGYLASSMLPHSITAFCTFLITKGVISPWQCAKLRDGRWKGFFADSYRILDHLECDGNYSYYLARENETGVCVRLRITPPSRTQGSGIEYRVDREF